MQKLMAAIMVAFAVATSASAGPAEDKALWDAALARDIEGVKSALKNGANANTPSATARPTTPLAATAIGTWRLQNDRAINLQKNRTAAKLSEAGFSDDEIDKYLAVEAAKLLFAAGAKLSRYDKTILFHAIARGNLELVRLLLDHGASVIGDLEGYTPAELARKYSQTAVYDLLISRGGIPVESGMSAQLALIEAAGIGDIEGMERAIQGGAKIDSFDSDKTTALIAAARQPIYRRRQAETIWWLLDRRADPNLKGESNFRGIEGVPLHLFVAMNKYPLEGTSPDYVRLLAEETLRRLLIAGAKISGIDETGRTPLHVAAKFDNVRAAEILIEEGAKVMPRDKTGKTPLDYAESAIMIKLLKQNGATER